MLTTDDLLSALLFMIPAYVANSTPIIFGGGKAIDFDKRFIDGERILGANKTIRGFISGLIFGSLVGIVEGFAMSQGMIQSAFLIPLGSLSGILAEVSIVFS